MFIIFITIISTIQVVQSLEVGTASDDVADEIVTAQKDGIDFSGQLSQPSTVSLSSGEVNIPSGSTVSVSNGDLTSSNIDVAETKSGVKIRNSLDTTISKNGNVALSSADSVKIGTITITNVKNFKYDDETKSFGFDSAQKLTESTRLFSFDNLKETIINMKNDVINQLVAKTDTKQSFKSLLIEGTVETSAAKDGEIVIDLINYKDNQAASKIKYEIKKSTLTIKNMQQKPIITAQPSKDTQIIEITKTDDGFITRAENSIITVSTDQIDERFIGNETFFEWNQLDGINKAVLESPGAYRYTFKELQVDRNGIFARATKSFAQGFEISRRNNLEKYMLSIDKPSKRINLEDFTINSNNAYVSLINHLIKLNGITTYSRINFDLKTTQRFMGGSWWLEVLPADGSFLPILDSFTDNRAVISLDSNNIHANITANPKLSTGKSYTAYFDDVAISESQEGLERSWITAPFIIDELTTTSLKFKNVLKDSWVVAQINNGAEVAYFISKNDAQQKMFDKEINDYADLSCDALNQKLAIPQELISKIRGLLQ